MNTLCVAVASGNVLFPAAVSPEEEYPFVQFKDMRDKITCLYGKFIIKFDRSMTMSLVGVRSVGGTRGEFLLAVDVSSGVLKAIADKHWVVVIQLPVVVVIQVPETDVTIQAIGQSVIRSASIDFYPYGEAEEHVFQAMDINVLGSVISTDYIKEH